MLIQKLIANAVMKLLSMTDSEKKRTAMVDKLCDEKIVNPVIRQELIDTFDLPLLSYVYNGAKQPPMSESTPDEVRTMYELLSYMFAGKADASVAQIPSELEIEKGVSLPVITFKPESVGDNARGIVFYPGGGFVIGSPKTHATFCSLLAAQTKSIVVSVEYRKGPEITFPQGHIDSINAWKAINKKAGDFGIDAKNIFVCGDSAGANLSAVVSEHARRKKDVPAPRGQILIYPVTDMDLVTESYQTYGEGLGLTQEVMAWFFTQYFGIGEIKPGESPSVPDEELEAAKEFFPMTQADLKGIAPALLINAKCDPLLTDGTGYGEKLKAEGALHKHVIYDGVVHNFINMGGTFAASRKSTTATLAEAVEFINKFSK